MTTSKKRKKAITCSNNSLTFQPAPPQNPFTVPSRARHSLAGHPWRCINTQWLLRVCVYIKLIANPFTCIFFHDMWTNLTKLRSQKKQTKYELALPESNPPFSSNPSSTASKSTGCCSICQAWQMACFILIGWTPLPWQELRSLPFPPSYPLFWHLSSILLWLLSPFPPSYPLFWHLSSILLRLLPPLPWLTKVVGRWEWNDQKVLNTHQVVGLLGVGTFHASEISVWVLLQLALYIFIQLFGDRNVHDKDLASNPCSAGTSCRYSQVSTLV